MADNETTVKVKTVGDTEGAEKVSKSHEKIGHSAEKASRQASNSFRKMVGSLTDIKAALPGPTDAQWGFTRTAFLFAYGLAVPFAGIAADMMRRKWVVVAGALMFTASVFGTGYVDGFVGMLVMYGLMSAEDLMALLS